MKPDYHPDATIDEVPGHPGKNWSGGNGKTKLVLHTLEYERWPNPEGTWACPHLTYNPWTQHIRQHVPFSKAAYSLRDNTDEDDKYTYQVEMWGRAADVPNYNDQWYEGVGKLIRWFVDNLDLDPVFRPVWLGSGSGAASEWSSVRMPQEEWDVFSGICGHQHFGRGVDTHWDPGALDVAKVQRYMEGDNMPTLEEFVQMVRPVDIEKMAADKIISEGDAAYALSAPRWINVSDKYASAKTNPSDVDWKNLYLAYKVRAPIWAV
jgi:hypothetical protein